MKKWKLIIDRIELSPRFDKGWKRFRTEMLFNTKKEAMAELSLVEAGICLNKRFAETNTLFEIDVCAEIQKYDSEYEFWDDVLYRKYDDALELLMSFR